MPAFVVYGADPRGDVCERLSARDAVDYTGPAGSRYRAYSQRQCVARNPADAAGRNDGVEHVAEFVAGPAREAAIVRIQVVMTLPREARSVPVVRHTVATALRAAGVTDECVAEVEVALSEACTNVYRHAGHGVSYEVVMNVRDEQLTMDVLDSGAGFGDLGAERTTMAELDAEGGRGIALMRALTDRAVFDTVTGRGGSVHLMKQLRWSDEDDGRRLTA
jgi:serine/threonine-protein kinase RsbW